MPIVAWGTDRPPQNGDSDPPPFSDLLKLITDTRAAAASAEKDLGRNSTSSKKTPLPLPPPFIVANERRAEKAAARARKEAKERRRKKSAVHSGGAGAKFSGVIPVDDKASATSARSPATSVRLAPAASPREASAKIAEHVASVRKKNPHPDWACNEPESQAFHVRSLCGGLLDPEPVYLQPRILNHWDIPRTLTPVRAWPSFGCVASLYDKDRHNKPAWVPVTPTNDPLSPRAQDSPSRPPSQGRPASQGSAWR